MPEALNPLEAQLTEFEQVMIQCVQVQIQNNLQMFFDFMHWLAIQANKILQPSAGQGGPLQPSRVPAVWLAVIPLSSGDDASGM